MDERFLIEEALERCDGDREFLLELIDMFFQELPSNLGELEDALKKKDCERVFKKAHALKSSLGNLGAGIAFKTAKSLEIAGRSNNLDECVNLFCALERDIKEFNLSVKEKLSV